MNLHEAFWATIAWMATQFALACVGCVGATYLISVCVNAWTRRASHLDVLRRASAAASLPIGLLLIALTIDPTRVDCVSLLAIAGVRVAIVVAGFGVLYIAVKAVFGPRP
jgi:hypothetical protein